MLVWIQSDANYRNIIREKHKIKFKEFFDNFKFPNLFPTLFPLTFTEKHIVIAKIADLKEYKKIRSSINELEWYQKLKKEIKQWADIKTFQFTIERFKNYKGKSPIILTFILN
jgi:hypothetical protein